ncbi:lipid II:glycine glycyltransferase FemX [Vagococcus hydrophili]|uniref:Peptidoglycan bridge formation glycyltransferase FemA/FemB family protein n=1 Tax=Vagococcus hydrophili TaxID=2714947 RepID=A0A6G8AS16_9ENTE|nr:peptidoglycan bridge formation glycyltransferase FemA/FemB family protein [Vagococcus hydrophili]QIL47715.1 peptidoglycan bridge formation glycyltransferase FemA/FemB family protein [Vagococcus hydrophili]
MALVNLANPEEIKRYEDFILNSPYTATTQDMAWAQVKNNWEPFYIYLEKEDEIIAAMSILTVASVGEKKIAYATRGPVCDVNNIQLVTELYDEAEKQLSNENIFLLRTDPEVFYNQELSDAYKAAGFKVRNKDINPHSTIQPRLNMRLDTENKTEEELLSEFHSKTRYNIRLAKRKGIEVHSSRSLEDLKAFYDTHVIMSERQGISYRPYEYFERVLKAYGDNAKVFIATFEGEVLAGALCLSYGNVTWYMYGGSNNLHRNKMPNYLMQWEMIKWGLERGTKYYDFGGIFEMNEEDGLYKFKRGFVGSDKATEFIGEIDRVYDEESYYIFLNE